MKKHIVLVILFLFGIYWLVDHAAPLPLNHEMFGLYNHNIHRALGVFLFVVAGLVWWKWHPKS